MQSKFALLSALTLLAASALAQTTATIVGTVTDSSGAVVPNTKVTAVHKATGLSRTTLANQSGNYVLPLLPVGEFELAAEITGFKRKTVSGIVLQVNQEPRVDIVLEVGAVTETVNVSAEAAVLQTENAVVGQVVDNRYTTQIPLNGRDFTQLVLLVPGATTRPGGFDQTVGAATGSFGSGVAIGGRDNQNNFTLDGAGNNARQFGNIAIKPSVDSIQEFKVQTSSYPAEMGQAAFGQISLITKSGTNSLHGSLFEFWRNDVFDARNFFIPKPSRLNRNQFGGAVGGPIVRNHAFFFFNYEGNRERRGVELTRSVPIQAWRDGDFSGIAGLTLRDPQSPLPFPGNKIPSGRFSKAATAALGLWPKQNFGNPVTTISNNLLVTEPNRFSDDQITFKGDWELTQNDHLSGRYSRAAHNQTTVGALLPGFELFIPPHNTVALLNLTHIFTPHVIGEFRTSFTRSEFVQCSPNCYKTGYYSQFGINHPLAGAQFEGAPSLTFSNITLTTFGDDDFNYQRDISNEFNYAGNLSWTHSNHTVKTGFTVTRFQQNTPGPVTGLRRGSFAFRGDFTGNAFADLLLGFPFTASRVVGKGVETGRSWWHGYFVQDDWKVTRKLTINIGLRYEYISPLLDNLDRRSTFWPLSNNYGGPAGQVVVADPSYCSTTTRPCSGAKDVLGFDGVARRAVYKPDRNNFAPRFGFAYSMNPKTVIRGGYGIFYTNSQSFLNNFVINRRQPPFAETQAITSSTTTPQINISDPFVGASAALVINTQNINPYFVEGYTQQWNLTVQRVLPLGINLEAAYVANKGTKLGELTFYNVPTPGPTATIQARRPFPTWGTALSLDSYVTSNYNSLQVKGTRRIAKGMSLLGAYTYAKSIDLSSERGSGDRGGGFDTGGGNVRDLRGYSRGRSGFDVRQRLVLSTVYEIPIGQGKALFKNLSATATRLIGGWELSGIGMFQSGFPTTATMSADINGDGIGDRPDFVAPLQYNPRNPDCYVVEARNPACGTTYTSFVDLPAGSTRFGSAGRNIVDGPGLVNWDMGLSKNTRFGHDERFNVQFRWEVFNVPNRANFNQPNRVVNVTAPRFGTITSAGRAREMQFGLKLAF